MTNEELVKLIQEGEQDKLPILWEQVERFVYQQANRRVRQLECFGSVSVDDLYQSGFIALVGAVESYDAEKGMIFIGWLAFHLKTEFAEAAGYRTEHQRRDPIHRAGSLDAPLQNDEDGTLADIIPDPTDCYEDMDQRIYQEQLTSKLGAALAMIPEHESSTLSRRYFQNQTLKQIAEQDSVTINAVRQSECLGLRKLRNPRISKDLRQFIEERTPYYLKVGTARFNTTNTSAVEEIAMLRERLLESRKNDLRA